MTQKEIYDYLLANPLQTNVCVGQVDDLNGQDYIILDFLNEDLIGYDDKGTYRTYIQMTVATKDFENRKTLVSYIKQKFNVEVNYETSAEFQYFLARCRTGILLNG